MHKNSFFKHILFLGITLLFASCDKDFNVIGDGLIGGNHFGINKESFSVTAFTQKTGAVQSDNLTINPFGINKDANFGTTNANFVSQVALQTPGIIFGANAKVESVVLNVPYFSKKVSTDANGDSTYKLDSIYGNKLGKMKLRVYESGYYLRDLDPNTGYQEVQRYYNDQKADFDTYKIGNHLNDAADLSQNDQFYFNPSEIKVTDANNVVTRSAPAMNLYLNKTFFENKILKAPAGKLSTNDVFKDYFRGLYFTVEQAGAELPAMSMMNFKAGKITIKYTETDAISGTTVSKMMILEMNGKTVSLLNSDFSTNGSTYNNLPNTGNTTVGDDKLYLKGGEGSLSVIELFGKTDLIGYDENGNTTGPNGVSDELDNIRKNDWLINEASLVFRIDQSAMNTISNAPYRVYLYDIDNDLPIVDYLSDKTTSGSDPKKDKTVYSGIIEKKDGKGILYKVRITDYIRYLTDKKITPKSVRLGLTVTENINDPSLYKLKKENTFTDYFPRMAVTHPFGTVLYGTGGLVSPENKVKFEIHYTSKSN